MIAVRDHFGSSGGRAGPLPVVITFSGDPERLAAYRAHLGLEFPVVDDAERALYDLLGARRTSYARVWNPGTLALYGRLIARGRRLGLPRDDTRQLGADALVDASGVLRRVWLPESPDARPALDELTAAIRSLR